LTERELPRLYQALDANQNNLGLIELEGSQPADSEKGTRLKKVLAEIQGFQRIEIKKRNSF